MFGRDGPRYSATRNMVSVYETAVTRTAGQTPSAPFQPEIKIVSQKGRIRVRTGSWWTTMRPISTGSTPDVCPAVTIGMPMLPKATGALLASRQRLAAYSGWNPSPTSIPVVIATGAPKPAHPSRNAPKQNAISSACKRRSAVMDSMLRVTVGEAAAFDAQVVQEHGGNQNPADGEQAVDHAVDGGQGGQFDRHPEGEGRDQKRDDQGGDGGEMTGDLAADEQREQDDDRQNGHGGGGREVVERVGRLLPHG